MEEIEKVVNLLPHMTLFFSKSLKNWDQCYFNCSKERACPQAHLESQLDII